MRALPPALSEPLLKECQNMTLDFLERLFNWKSWNFWNAAHRKLVRWNLELPLKEGGTGCLPFWLIAKAAYAASWYQPVSTIAQASALTELEVLQKWNESDKLPSVKLLKDTLKKLGHDSDLTSPYEKFHADLENQIQSKCSKLPSDLGDIERKDAEWEIRNNVMSSLKWQRFFSGEILKKYSEKHARAVSKSKLWFKEFDEERIKDRKDPFATKIFQTSLWEHRTRVTLEDFQLSRSYFFGVFLRNPKDEDGTLCMYPCYLTNDRGIACSKQCDPFGHHAHVCAVTNKTLDHNHARDIVKSMGGAIGFIADKEVVVCPWEKKPDVELVDPSGELLTIYLDITLPALHQEAIKSRTEVFKRARAVKNKSYPRKDEHGRLLTESSCLPFILTSMGGLCEEGHEFLRVCRKRNPEKTKHLIDVLVTQHSRWVASRMRRSLFGQATSTAVESCDHKQQHFSSQCARTTGVRAQPVKNSSRNTAGSMRRLKAAFSNSIETPKVGSQIGQDGEIFPSSPS